MELLERLQNWYQLHCDGDWEHSYGIKIDTLDNPGWQLSVDLTDTLLEDVEFQPIHMEAIENKNTVWVDCQKVDKTFVGTGSVDSLEKILSVFLDWADDNSDASEWDEEVDSLIEQCKNCNNIDQLRKLYWNIDSVPSEHMRKTDLVKLFDEKWNRLIGNT